MKITKTEIKKQFQNFLKSLKDEDVNVEVYNLKLVKECLHDFSFQLEGRKDKIVKKYHYCKNCFKYVKTKKSTFRVSSSTTIVQTYCDAGYGDDDRYANQLVYKTYASCPRCGKDILIKIDYGDIIPGTEMNKYGVCYN